MIGVLDCHVCKKKVNSVHIIGDRQFCCHCIVNYVVMLEKQIWILRKCMALMRRTRSSRLSEKVSLN